MQREINFGTGTEATIMPICKFSEVKSIPAMVIATKAAVQPTQPLAHYRQLFRLQLHQGYHLLKSHKLNSRELYYKE